MKIVRVKQAGSCVFWAFGGESGSRVFKSKDGREVIELGVGTKFPEMSLCHELGHLFLTKRFAFEEYKNRQRLTVREEVMCWRLAKSYCKKHFWNEEYAKDCLSGYFKSCEVYVNLKKLKIIELNRGVRVSEDKQ
jgi:hypothetical protein